MNVEAVFNTYSLSLKRLSSVFHYPNSLSEPVIQKQYSHLDYSNKVDLLMNSTAKTNGFAQKINRLLLSSVVN